MTTSPVDTNFFTGLQLNLTCNIHISVPQSYEISISAQWSKSGSNITTNNSRYSVDEGVIAIAPSLFQTGLVLHSLNRSEGDEGNYTCMVVALTPNFLDIIAATGSVSLPVVVESNPVVVESKF